MEFTYGLIGHNLMGVGKYFKLYMKKELQQYDFNVAEGLVLLALYGKDGQTQEQLLEEVHYDKSVMTRTMQSLETKGYIVRKENIKDGRSYVFDLTQKGMEFKENLINILNNWSEIAFEGISKEQLEKLKENLDKIISNTNSII